MSKTNISFRYRCTPDRFRNRSDGVSGNHTDAPVFLLRQFPGFAVDPGSGSGSEQRIRRIAQDGCQDAAQYVSAAGSGHAGTAGVGEAGGFPVRDDRCGSLQQQDCSGFLRVGFRRGERTVLDFSDGKPGQPGEFLQMRGENQGAGSVEDLSRFNFTKSFMGTNGISDEKGFSTPDVDEALVKTAAVRHASQSYVLADHTKFGVVTPITFANLWDCCIITDTIPDSKYSDLTMIKSVSQQ